MLKAASQMVLRRNFCTINYQKLENYYKKMEFGAVVDEVNKYGVTNQPGNIKSLYFNSIKAIEEEAKISNEIQNKVDSISLKYKISPQQAYELLKQQAMKNTLNPNPSEGVATQSKGHNSQQT